MRDDGGQGQALDQSENRSLEDGDGGGGDNDGIEEGRNDPHEEAACRGPRDATNSAVGGEPTGAQEEPGGNGETDRGERSVAEAGAGGERQQAMRRPDQGERRRDKPLKEAAPKVFPINMEKGETGEKVVDTAPADSSQKVQRVHHMPENERIDAEPENRQQEEWPVAYRPPPEDFWRSVEGRALSSSEIEGVLDGVTEQDAERYLRDKGMVDSDGNLKPPSGKS